jgi:hypothetical protein
MTRLRRRQADGSKESIHAPRGLRATVDGTPLAPEEAERLWKRFSDWMEEHKGDLQGFAKSEGFTSVHPAVEGGLPVLCASRSTPQQPYAPVANGGGVASPGGGGSRTRHEAPPHPARRGDNRPKSRKKPGS